MEQRTCEPGARDSDGQVMPLYAVDFNKLTAKRTEIPEEWQALRRPIVLCVGRLIKVKNIDGLIVAWKDKCARSDRGSLLIVGGGPESKWLKELAAGLPRDRLQFAGPLSRDQMDAPFRLADALVLPSRREPWGIVITEALGCGLPVLASDAVGAAVSLVREYPKALMVHPTTHNGLSEGLSELLDDLPRRREAAGVVATLVRDTYDVNRVAERLVTWERWRFIWKCHHSMKHNNARIFGA